MEIVPLIGEMRSRRKEGAGEEGKIFFRHIIGAEGGSNVRLSPCLIRAHKIYECLQRFGSPAMGLESSHFRRRTFAEAIRECIDQKLRNHWIVTFHECGLKLNERLDQSVRIGTGFRWKGAGLIECGEQRHHRADLLRRGAAANARGR
jgi:hypothetical protein